MSNQAQGIPQSSSRRKNATWIGSVLGLVVACSGGYWWMRLNTYHLATVQAGVLYRDGVSSMRKFKTAMRMTHARTIVRLIDDKEASEEPFTDEAQWCKQEGIAVKQINISPGGSPTEADVERFLAIVQDPANQPVLVHCHQGVNRTGMMVAAYQMSVMGYSRKKAVEAILRFGHSSRSYQDVLRFIDGYKLARRDGAAVADVQP